jgi:hypothetical protein
VYEAVQPSQERPSREHSKLEPASLAEKVKLGVESLTGPAGPDSIEVSGATVSTVNERVAGVPSVLPAGSVARTYRV